jgi:hypothetical protein
MSDYPKFISFIALTILALATDAHLYANQAVYQDPFDQAAGGAALTRASQDAVMFANPAMMPFGTGRFRWAGTQWALITGKDSYEEAKALASSSDTSTEDGTSTYIDKVFGKPLHFGGSSVFSVIMSHFGLGAFARFEADVAGKKHDITGLPQIRARAEAYGGGVTSLAHAPLPWLGFGMTARYMYKAEPDLSLSLSDQAKIEELQSDPQALIDENKPGQGMGFDMGALVFLQGKTVDYRLALKVDDIGDTNFSEAQSDSKQMMHVGTGLTFHNSTDALHLSLDLRDVTGVSGDTMVMRTYAGAKLLIRRYVGLAAGLYQGYPSCGFRVDLLLVKAGFTYYQREMGDFAGDDGRPIYIAYVAVGI